MEHFAHGQLPRSRDTSQSRHKEAPPIEGDFKAVVSGVATELRKLLSSMPGVIVPSRIDSLLRIKVEDPLKKERLVNRTKALSYLNSIKGAITGLHTELGAAPDPADVGLRMKALEILGKAIKDLNVEDPRKIDAENAATRSELLRTSRRSTETYVSWLADSMRDASSIRWSASNVITALFNLSLCHKEWRTAPRANEALSNLIERLYLTSQERGVKIDGMDLINLTGSTPTIVDALKHKWNKDPNLERKFFEGAARLVQCATEGPGTGIVEEKFLKPLAGVSTSLLTPEGAVAACRYAAAVQDTVAQLPGSQELHNIAAHVRALKGITSWHVNDETQAYLTNTLKGIADRLSSNEEIGSSRMLGEILHGLRGVNGAELSEQNQKMVARVIREVVSRWKSYAHQYRSRWSSAQRARSRVF